MITVLKRIQDTKMLAELEELNLKDKDRPNFKIEEPF